MLTQKCVHEWYVVGPCLTTAIWCCCKPFSQWHRSFHRKLGSHWLKFLRQCHVAVVRQGPAFPTCTSAWHFQGSAAICSIIAIVEAALESSMSPAMAVLKYRKRQKLKPSKLKLQLISRITYQGLKFDFYPYHFIKTYMTYNLISTCP